MLTACISRLALAMTILLACSAPSFAQRSSNLREAIRSLKINECTSLPATASVTPIKSTRSDWTRLTRLSPGQMVIVELATPESARGRMVSVDDNGIVVETPNGVRRFERAQVAQVTAESSRTLKVAWALTGVGAGLVIANAATRPGEAGPGKLWFVGAPIAVIGGVMVHSEMSRTGLVYRRP